MILFILFFFDDHLYQVHGLDAPVVYDRINSNIKCISYLRVIIPQKVKGLHEQRTMGRRRTPGEPNSSLEHMLR